VWGFGQADRAEVVALGRNDPDAARPAGVDVAGLVDLEPVDRVLALGASVIWNRTCDPIAWSSLPSS